MADNRTPESILRPWREEDIASLVHHANNIKVSRFLTDAFPFPYTEVHARQFITDSMSADPLQRFAIEVGGEAVGSIGIHPQSDIMRLNAELGYWLSEDYWGRGIMTGIIHEVVEYGFKHFDVTRIYARPFGNNGASARVLEKLDLHWRQRSNGTSSRMVNYSMSSSMPSENN